MNFHPGSIVHMCKLITSDEKKVIILFLEFRLKFLGFLRQPNETLGIGKRSKFSSSLDQLLCKFFQSVRQARKSSGAEV